VFQGDAGAFNAGLFAARILVAHDPALRKAYRQYETDLESAVVTKDSQLKKLGATEYLQQP
jgi:5-(carboxyamino)imidazole ribonucleotide mutase